MIKDYFINFLKRSINAPHICVDRGKVWEGRAQKYKYEHDKKCEVIRNLLSYSGFTKVYDHGFGIGK
jgi:hypothetical protein